MNPSPRLQTLFTVLPVLTAGLYLLGLSYHQGYLAAFGVDDSLFPLSSDKALFTGFLSLLIVAFPASLYAIGAIGAFVVLVLLAAVLSSTARVRAIVSRFKAGVSGRPRVPIPPVAEGLIDKGAVAYGYVAGAVLSLLLVLAIAAFAAKGGRGQGDREITAFTRGEATSAEVFSPQLPQPFVGKLVICGETYCAIWASSGTLVMGHEGIDRIVTHNPSLKGTAPGKPASAP